MPAAMHRELYALRPYNNEPVAETTKRKRSDSGKSLEIKTTAAVSVSVSVKKIRTDSASASSRESDAKSALESLEECVADAHDAWEETDSLLEEALQETETPTETKDFKPCTPQEAVSLRRDLQTVGPSVFCQRTVDCGRYTAKKLITAFGVNPPAFLEGQPDEMYYDYLSLVMTRELAKRAKLMQHNSVDDVVDLIATSQNIMVVTGAGISTSLGIPDFRSKGTGLYSRLEHLGLSDPQEVFDIRMFREDPKIFYSVARDILPATTRFTPTHKFISMLHDRGKLLTNYTQNIDNLEMAAGIPRDKLIQCHGSFGTASCIDCKYQVPGDRIFDDIRSSRLPMCPRCEVRIAARKKATKRKPKKSRWDDDDDESDESDEGPAEGIMKPDITFFGEELPDAFSQRLAEHDRDKVDLVIIIGTSLKVRPVSEIVNFLPPDIPQIYLSREAIQHTRFDVNLLGDCDVIIAELCRRLKWKLAHEMVPKDQVVRVKLQDGYVSRHQFEVVRPREEEK